MKNTKAHSLQMKNILLFSSLLLVITQSIKTLAFDINTHTAMTSEAIKQSTISATPNTSPILKKLGVFDREFAIGSSYVDIGALIRRDATDFERRVMDAVGNTGQTELVVPSAASIPGWIIRGAVREDDNTIETPQGRPEGDEPNGVFDRE